MFSETNPTPTRGQHGPAGRDSLPYCGTQFRFDPRLGPSEADPPDSLFVDPDPG